METYNIDNENYRIRAFGNNTFTVNKSISMKYKPSDPVFDFLKIGGKDMCVEYMFNRNGSMWELQWLHTDGQQCVDGEMTIRGENTIHLFYLSVQLLKKYAPITHINFLDNSHFRCKLPNGKIEKMFLNHYYFLFHKGRTWYDGKLHAYPTNEIQKVLYDSFSQNFTNPSCKPSYFDFMNNDLNDIFQPIWNRTRTWQEFLSEIKQIPDICQKTYTWYMRASAIIRNHEPLPEYWTIGVHKKLPVTTIEKMSGGKRIKKYICDNHVCPDYPDVIKCRNLRYSKQK
jgi:hypothetical protein